jgi:hypothetical protein
MRHHTWMVLLLCGCFPLFAAEAASSDGPSLADTALTPFDYFQKRTSHVIRRFSSNVDERLSHVFDDENVSESLSEEEEFSLLDYFTDDTAFDPTNRSYVRLVGGYEFDRRGDNSQILDITARIILPKTQNRLQLFIGDETKETGDLSTLDTEEERTGVGLQYYFGRFAKLLHPNVVLGLSGIDNPYLKGRVSYPMRWESLLVKPSQTVRYSGEKEFEEWTDLLFAYRVHPKRMLRLLLRRSTERDVEGMAYLAQLSYYKPSFHHTGLRPYVGIDGRTKALSEPYENGTPAGTCIYNYTAGVIWKDSFLRDYLFYQVHPAVEYHEQYDYRPNYILRLSVELFIGEH